MKARLITRDGFEKHISVENPPPQYVRIYRLPKVTFSAEPSQEVEIEELVFALTTTQTPGPLCYEEI
jgi:hypothetical protein